MTRYATIYEARFAELENLTGVERNDAEALTRLAMWLTPVLRAVAIAAGPKGRACLLDAGGGVERAATALVIVRELAEERGAPRLLTRVLREILFETDRDLGDGTARVALLCGGLVAHGARSVAAGIPACQLADALARFAARLSVELGRATAEGRSDRDDIAGVAESAGATSEVAQAIADMLALVGTEGAVEIVAGREAGLRLESGEGFLFDAVAASDAFAAADLDPAYIMVADERIDEFGPLVPLLEGFATRGKALVVVARDVSGPALHALVRNHAENGLRTIALRPALASQGAADALEDLAIATGATLVTERLGTSVATFRPGMLGRCARFSFAGGRAVLHGPDGDPGAVAQRRAFLLGEADRQKFLTLDRDRLHMRAARLRSSWARLHLGAATERETRTEVAGARRALASARSALIGGVLPGGGVGLVHGFDRLPFNQADLADVAISAGYQVLAGGLAALVHGLATHPIPTRILAVSRPGRLGDRLGLQVDHLGSLDPVLLTRSVLDRAVFGAIALLRTGSTIHD